MAQLLSEDAISSRLEASGWEREGEEIVREYKLTDFTAAIDFVKRVAELAQAADHHPDILLHGYNKVRLSLTNHSAGGLTDADFALAARIDAIA